MLNVKLLAPPLIDFVNVVGVCGGYYYDDQGTFSSPNYPNPYPNNQYCYYYINTVANRTITINFNAFSLEDGPSCPWDYVQVNRFSRPPIV